MHRKETQKNDPKVEEITDPQIITVNLSKIISSRTTILRAKDYLKC